MVVQIVKHFSPSGKGINRPNIYFILSPTAVTKCQDNPSARPYVPPKQGRLSPPNTLEQVFPSLLPPFPSPPFPFPSVPLSSPPLISRPLIAARLGERSPAAPAAKRYLVNFRLKIWPLVATIFRSFPEINHSVFAET